MLDKYNREKRKKMTYLGKNSLGRVLSNSEQDCDLKFWNFAPTTFIYCMKQIYGSLKVFDSSS